MERLGRRENNSFSMKGLRSEEHWFLKSILLYAGLSITLTHIGEAKWKKRMETSPLRVSWLLKTRILLVLAVRRQQPRLSVVPQVCWKRRGEKVSGKYC